MSYHKYTPSTDLQKTIIRCPYTKCQARIIKPNDQKIHSLKTGYEWLKVDQETNSNEKEIDEKFLRIEDSWDFDNIGVSREIPSKVTEIKEGETEELDQIKVERFIICADCERGPLGFGKFDDDEQDKNVKNLKFYLHLNSCVYQDL
ncbi:hypothetical protein BN7_1013 [Wickerhamomyces ciferrii]|uniref:Guanine nucleotide exchange factor MSS4 n=1 Tax=Wickerhamomyces ciferrii (strain ATCC 14091 / BCRC 22168 / CBS 111 / JCM 3599 / NBRC 0793 / NRRL Y-1031 F-60-10) TaxID=1206466 RepID=K0KH09_WICCF|nr:uncharacterized protein BN7_1013 [Wickerhamomyces ciferrii]CCH41472.1 hypothetical protein BN7_1013 [Wickerhamomyces ciferrii]